MDLLLAGDLTNLADQFCKQLSGRNRLVLASKYIAKGDYYKKPATFPFAPNDPLFERLFDSYNFGAVIFLAKRGEQTGQQTGMIEDLDHCLKLCTKHNVSHVIYVCSSEVYAGNDHIDERCSPMPMDSIGHILVSGENLVRFYRQRYGLNTIIVHVPYLYGDSIHDSLLASLCSHSSRKEKFTFNGSDTQQCDFIRDVDLVAFLARLIDDGYELPQGVINLGTGEPISLGKLCSLVKREIPDFDYEFNAERCIPAPMKVETAGSFYGWSASHRIEEDLTDAVMKCAGGRPKKKKSLAQLFGKGRNRVIILTLELGLGFAVMQLLNHLSSTAIQYRYVDFRLLFIVVFTSIYGLRIGMLAVLLAFASCLLSYYGTGLDWTLLFYNVDNWMPFFVYFVVGAVTGYAKDKSVSAHEQEKQQRNSVEEKYVYLYELYDQTLKNKRQYQNQLLSYRDSFGRIYAITKRLDNVLPDSVMLEAVEILEDVLENQTIAIYNVEQNGNYARLAVSSKSISNRIQSTIKLSQYKKMMREIKNDDIWCNKEFLDGYPAYSAPVYHEGKLHALIMINEVRYEKMTTYYFNLIKVLCGLIKDSLIRAIQYCSAIEDKMYLDGTRILKQDRFEDILAVKQRMREENVASFELFRINNYFADITKLSHTISQCIRSTDILGQGRDGNIYLILSQVEHESIDLVLGRLVQNGIHCVFARSSAIKGRAIETMIAT